MEAETKNELALLVEKSGLEIETAKSLQETFLPFYEQALEWNEKAKTIKVTDATQLTEMKQAREARLALKAIRTGVENRRKELKEDSLRKGKAIDGVANLLKALIEPTETYLQEQEDFAKIAEAKRKSELANKRLIELQAFNFQYDNGFNLGEISEEAYQSLFAGIRKTYEEKIAAEKKAEEERIAREEAEMKERERLRLENEELKRKQEEQERLLREERMKAEQERKAAEEAARKEREETERKFAEEKAKADAEQKAMREEAQKKLAVERAEREKVEAELKAKQEAEAKAIAEAEASAEAEAAKGDKEKFQDYINAMEALKGKYTFRSKKYKALGASVDELLNKTINWAISKQ